MHFTFPIKLAITAATLGVSAFIAFGPFRNRLPRFLTVIAKYSMALKLLTIAAFAGFALYYNIREHGPLPLSIGYGLSDALLVPAALFIATRGLA